MPQKCVASCGRSFTSTSGLANHRKKCNKYTQEATLQKETHNRVTSFRKAAAEDRQLARQKAVAMEENRPHNGTLRQLAHPRLPDRNEPPVLPNEPILSPDRRPELPGDYDVPQHNLFPSLVTVDAPVTPPGPTGYPFHGVRIPRPFRNSLPHAPPQREPSGEQDTGTQPQPAQGPRQVILIVRDHLATTMNIFHVWRQYLHRPSFDPDTAVPLGELANKNRRYAQNDNEGNDVEEDISPDLAPSNNSVEVEPPPPWPFRNMTVWRLMQWANTGSTRKSMQEVNRLVNEVVSAKGFKPEDLQGFDANKENRSLDMAADNINNPALEGLKETSVDIDVPSGQKNIPSASFSVSGLFYRDILSVIKEAFTGPLASKFHLSPFQLRHAPEGSDTHQRVYGELYTADSFIREHDHIQRLPLPPDEPECQQERVVAALMWWSDSTHLANFGTASLWPIYLLFGNLSKYIRAQPTSGACYHVAYIPKLPDSFKDWVQSFHRKWRTQKRDILTHCRRELIHAIWRLLLNDEFVHAYKYGIIIMCHDGVERRVFPRIFTYGANYPEKVLLATICDQGLCPCPCCLVPKTLFYRMGLVADIKLRLSKARQFMVCLVLSAREFIYSLAKPIGGVAVNKLLKSILAVPTMNAFVERLGAYFNPSDMLVVDLMHEFELGVWKNLFTHLICVLYAAPNGSDLVDELDRRFREIPTFGKTTIRRFATNASEMKKLAARDFEDLLQLLFRTAEWHAYAKLRLHTDATPTRLEELTKEFGRIMRDFEKSTCSEFNTLELPQEVNARARQKAKTCVDQNTASAPSPSRLVKKLNLNIYKFHAMGDYVQTIQEFGTTDSYSTQLGELAHREVKSGYTTTSKRKAAGQIARRHRREKILGRHRIVHSRMHKHDPHGPVPWSHYVGFAASESLEPMQPLVHYHISNSRKSPTKLAAFVRKKADAPLDPAKKNFWPKLQDHLYGRLHNRAFDADMHQADPSPSLSARNTIQLVNRAFFTVNTLCINYTTYNVWRDYDVINPNTEHRDVMVYAPDADDDLYWYARVLGVYHAEVAKLDSQNGTSEVQQVNFLWVRWFGSIPRYRPGMAAAKLPKIGFVTEGDDPNGESYTFGFLDPNLVIRACHLVPDFHEGRTDLFLPTNGPTAARKASDGDDDWWYYFVNIFADRDMLMRYSGGGIGHTDVSVHRQPNDNTEVINPEEAVDVDEHHHLDLRSIDEALEIEDRLAQDDSLAEANNDSEDEAEASQDSDEAESIQDSDETHPSEGSDLDNSDAEDLDEEGLGIDYDEDANSDTGYGSM
ncbi:hypothetical protein BDN71DRAFT_1584712 [Pleurotus eryngii]|uniref:C2H2-type domain-containing protein n=1 Tax=Pleurotus eryngii TaxID=5323 RepID=A0A9P6A8N8_PLEER|nr:hypothetical protein BDN71DRAFT_1584712 [Pleurotus eryngii]